MNKHEVLVEREKGIWKVKPGETQLKVKRGDHVHWQVRGSDITFFFPDETIFGLSCVKIPKDDDITLEVRRGKVITTDDEEKNLYAAFCHQAPCFAEQDSSPIIIIE